MLNPNNNRLNYGSILYPPNNYELDFAIGTTYSLDLDALVGSSIALGLSQETDSNLRENPIFLLEALRSTSDKIALFCENGRIHLPNNPTQIYILLEDMVFQASHPKDDKYSSFHPKFWLLRFMGEDGSILYRLIVLSMNLTFDRSWDISFTMEGLKTDEKTDKNDSISKFIEKLTEYSTNEIKSDKMKEIMDELSFVHFDLNSNIFNDYEFIINGIGEEYSIQKQPLFNENWDELFIMSPFLSNGIIKDFNNRKNKNSRATLITREMSLSRLKPEDCSNFDVYRLKDVIIDGEDFVSQENQQILKQDIHAKMYAMEKDDVCEFYLGSLNASHNAKYNNIEVMVKLVAKKKKFNVKALIKDIFNGEKDGIDCPFQPVDMNGIKPDAENEGTDLDLIIRKMAALNIRGNVIPNDSNYDIELIIENYDEFEGSEIKLSPLLKNDFVAFSENMVFENLEKIQLSEFFILSVSKDDDSVKRIIKIQMEGMPEDRKNDVISSIIDDETAFIRYVAFLLSDDYAEALIGGGSGCDGCREPGRGLMQLPELYEKMLKTAQKSPEKFIELDFLIKTLSKDNVVPEGFEELYNTFLGVLD